LVAFKPGVFVRGELGHELGAEGGAAGFVLGLPGEVDHLVRVVFEIVEFFGGAGSEAEIPVQLILRVVSVLDEDALVGPASTSA